MFQRIKGAIDSRIAEEQAKARSLHGLDASARSDSRSRQPQLRSNSTSRRPGRVDSRSRPVGPAKEPAEFDADFSVDDDSLSRISTPQPATEAADTSTDNGERNARSGKNLTESRNDQSGKENATKDTATELPNDVRARLRKLEKLESRYQELLRSYRIAHGRVQAIDVFETALRDSTPLTSITEPTAFVEYISQTSLKTDMVMQELKRVTGDRDGLKTKLAASEKTTQMAREEIEELRKVKSSAQSGVESNHARDGPDATKVPVSPATTMSTEKDIAKNTVTTTTPPPKKAISIPGLGLFSPKLGALSPSQVPQDAGVATTENLEDIFSFDAEIPRLQEDIRAKQAKINSLEINVENLKTDLIVARESTQSMVQTLEEATREVNTLRDSKEQREADAKELEEGHQKIVEGLREELALSHAQLERMQDAKEANSIEEHAILTKDLASAQTKIAALESKTRVYVELVEEHKILQNKWTQAEEKVTSQGSEAQRALDEVTKQLEEATIKLKQFQDNDVVKNQNNVDTAQKIQGIESVQVPDAGLGAQSVSAKKRNKKKKKGGKETSGESTLERVETVTIANTSAEGVGESEAPLQTQIESFQADLASKNERIASLQASLRASDELKEEIETLREELVNIGQEHVQSKESVKSLTLEKQTLERRIEELEIALQKAEEEKPDSIEAQQQERLRSDFLDLKTRASSLQRDLAAAQQLASTRFRDLDDLRTKVQKAQPEINALRSEAAEFKTIKETLSKRDADIRRLDSKHEELRSETVKLRASLASREADLKLLTQRHSTETTLRTRAEDSLLIAQKESNVHEADKARLRDQVDRHTKEITSTRNEIASYKTQVRDLEVSQQKNRSEAVLLREELDLKTAQHDSAQNLLGSMRDQCSEMGLQLKEARDKCESLDEELAEAHRLLGERAREAETMRRLLSEVEVRADARTREWKDRIDGALEERDRAEEEAATSSRRRARELEEARTQLRNVERTLKRSEDERDELEDARKEWKRRREELEGAGARTGEELAEVRGALTELRAALEESERQVHELGVQRGELRRSVEETQTRIEGMAKTNRALTEEIGKLRAEGKLALSGKMGEGADTGVGMGNTRIGTKVETARTGQGSVTKVNSTTNGATTKPDFVYLKNVLLQFLEQKDRKHQMQLIPVLSMLLHFDKQDEQKWMSVVSTKA